MTKNEHCLLLRVGVVGTGRDCMTTVRMLEDLKPGRLQIKVVGLAATKLDTTWVPRAARQGILIFDSFQQLLEQRGMDLILELSGDPAITSALMMAKPPGLGVLDRQASLMFFDIASMDDEAAHGEAGLGLATSFSTALLEASPDAVLVIDKNYRIVRCNESPLILRGRSRQEVEGRHCFEVMHGCLEPCSGPERECPMGKSLDSGHPARAVHEVTDADGERRIWHVTTYPLTNRMGEIVQVVDVIRDITADMHKQVEVRAQAIKDDLTRFVQDDRLVALGRLVASVCHEINNPISSIVTFNKLILSHLRDGSLPPEGVSAFERYLELSVKEALRCGGIVKNLLSFARQKSVEANRFDLVEMLETILMLTQHQMEMAQVRYALELPHKPLWAWGDYPQIQQCLMNLVFNAFDAMAGGGVIKIAAGSRKPDLVWVSVEDQGQGIDPDDLPYIFEPFYSTKPDGKGVGLGLSMVYGIISQHGGKVEVLNHPGQGAKFTVTLPAAPLQGEEEPAATAGSNKTRKQVLPEKPEPKDDRPETNKGAVQ